MDLVYISYELDDAAFASEVRDRLESWGFNVRVGRERSCSQEWYEEFRHALCNVGVVLTVVSDGGGRQAGASYVTFEWATALARGCTVIPLWLGGAIHYRLQEQQCVDFRGEVRWTRLLASFVAQAERLMESSAPARRAEGLLILRSLSSALGAHAPQSERELVSRGLRAALAHPVPQVCKDAILELVRSGDAHCRPTLVGLAAHLDAGVRAQAIRGLARLSHEPSVQVESLALKLLDDPACEVVSAAAEVLADHGRVASVASQLRQVVRPKAGVTDLTAAREAVQTLARLRDVGAAPDVIDYLDRRMSGWGTEPDGWDGLCAGIYALRLLSEDPGPALVQYLSRETAFVGARRIGPKQWTHEEPLREPAALVAAHLMEIGDRRVVTGLRELLDDPRDHVTTFALTVVAALGEEGREAVARKMLRIGGPFTRAAAVEILRSSGAAGAEALREALGSADRQVCAAVAFRAEGTEEVGRLIELLDDTDEAGIATFVVCRTQQWGVADVRYRGELRALPIDRVAAAALRAIDVPEARESYNAWLTRQRVDDWPGGHLPTPLEIGVRQPSVGLPGRSRRYRESQRAR